jgi:hypothetical protein
MTQKEVKQVAQDLLESAIRTVGGQRAWERMGYDAKIDALRAEAWKVVQRRWRPEQSDVWVGDVAVAMQFLYNTLDPDAT